MWMYVGNMRPHPPLWSLLKLKETTMSDRRQFLKQMGLFGAMTTTPVTFALGQTKPQPQTSAESTDGAFAVSYYNRSDSLKKLTVGNWLVGMNQPLEIALGAERP